MNTDVMLFFSKAPRALSLYEALETEILNRCPGATVHVQKSQIAFDNGKRFAFASLRGKRLVVTFGLGRRLDSPRIAQAVEPYPGRWTHHVVVADDAELNDELFQWIALAYDFAARK
ncbi:MAG: hypothetical protein IKB78_00850 [Clostridia bacterium]|nr:hypothetical protein [Clostridia bacterium]